MKFFQQTLLPDPLGPMFQRARKKMRLSLKEAAARAGISPSEAEAFENDDIVSPGTARLHALSYARALGLDPSEVRDCLPPAPGIKTVPHGYLASMANSGKRSTSAWDFLRTVMQSLAPLGRLALYLVMTAILLGTWGVMRQLSRVRSIPWVTSSSRPPQFHDLPNR